MTKIAIWYHGLFNGHSAEIEMTNASWLMSDQMHALDESGLLDEADEFHLAFNGNVEDVNVARLFCPCSVAQLCENGPEAQTEIPTLNRLRNWLPSHPDWYVLYLHMKGVSHPGNELNMRWRHCMEKALVWNWKQCVVDLNQGADSCGCHWLTPDKYRTLVRTPFWGGNFWWAKAQFLLTLPPLPADTRENRYKAEQWIGSGSQRPAVRDYHNEWPSMNCSA